MKIFSIIVTYNGMQWYDRCFGSLLQSEVPVNIIVIDNASSDNTVDYIKKKYPDITLIESNENLGFAKANNIGIRNALDNNADFVFLLNQDAWLNQTNTIAVLIEQSKLHPEFGILSPMQLYGSAKRIEKEVISYFARNANAIQDFVSDAYFNRVKELYEVPFACAVCWLLPIKTIREIGGFDPIFYHYGEDDNYIQRVHFFGYKIGICPKVSVCHDIENRSDNYRDENLDWKKYLLLNLADIRQEINIRKILNTKLKTFLLQILRLNKKLLKKTYPEYKYIRDIQSELIHSREQNKIKQPNWL